MPTGKAIPKHGFGKTCAGSEAKVICGLGELTSFVELNAFVTVFLCCDLA
jgi:hypothetical protein